MASNNLLVLSESIIERINNEDVKPQVPMDEVAVPEAPTEELTILEFEHDAAPKTPTEVPKAPATILPSTPLPFPTLEAQVTEVGTVEEKLEEPIPTGTFFIVAETKKVEADPLPEEKRIEVASTPQHNLVGSLVEEEEFEFQFAKLRVRNWSPSSGNYFSDYIKEGLVFKGQDPSNVVMLFETPSKYTAFNNESKWGFHDWPPPKYPTSKSVLGPCKYSGTTGSALPVFLRGGKPPVGLMEHWSKYMPGHVAPTFTNKISDQNLVYAYLPVEKIKHHVNDPSVHFHLCGKDAIHLMTTATTKLLPDTRESRPCVVKTTHSMGSKGIFIIRDDEDEKEFEQFLVDSGNPPYVVTDFVDIHRNVACHLFMHPNAQDVVWFGSNENKRNPDGSFSSDSYLYVSEQEDLKKKQLPFVNEVVQYCASLGFWGFLGIDVLFNSEGQGFLVDINPRVTGSCPALMTLQLMKKKFGFSCGLFRREGNINFYGDHQELFGQVEAHNIENEGKTCIVIHSYFEAEEGKHMRINIGVYGTDMDECMTIVNRFGKPLAA